MARGAPGPTPSVVTTTLLVGLLLLLLASSRAQDAAPVVEGGEGGQQQNGTAAVPTTTTLRESEDGNPAASGALECEIELTYTAVDISSPKFEATFAIRNNRPTELSAWQVVWRYYSEKLIPGSVEGAILLATGTSSGQPARVVNTRNNAPILPFSTKGFSFAAYSTLEDNERVNVSRAPESVSVNGLSCTALYTSQGLEGVREEFADVVSSVENCVPPMDNTSATEVLFLPSCEQTYCCGILTTNGQTDNRDAEELIKNSARKSLLPSEIIQASNDIAWTDCSANSSVVLVHNITDGPKDASENPLIVAMVEPGGYFGVCTNTSVGPLFGEDFLDFYMLANEEQAVSLSVALGVSMEDDQDEDKTSLQQLIETEVPLYSVNDINEGGPWKHVVLDLNTLSVPGLAFLGIRNKEKHKPIPLFLHDMGLFAAMDREVAQARQPASLNWEFIRKNENLTQYTEVVEETKAREPEDHALLPALLFALCAILVILVVAVSISIVLKKRDERKGKVETSSAHSVANIGASTFFNRLDIKSLKNAIVRRYEKGSSSLSPSVRLNEAPADGIFDVDFNAEIQVQEIIGSGGFGTVHKATWRGNDVAVKIMHGMTEGSKMLDTFKKEIFLLSRLKHQGIINFLGASLQPPNVCIVQELAEGGSLFTRLHGSGSENNPMKYVDILQYALDIADAMAYLHPNVVHRDLKSQNVLLDSNKRAKVCDFGIANFKDKTLLTTVNSQAGTPAYMAPELFSAGDVSEKVDVFSFGVLLWECFTGCVPWDELSTPMQVIFAVGVQRQRLPIPPHCPTFLAKLMQDCWKEDPDDRPTFAQILSWTEIEYEKYVAAKSLLVANGIEELPSTARSPDDYDSP